MISTTTSTASYTATAGQTVFAYPFRIQNQSDMLVFAEDTLGVRTNITPDIVSVSGVDNEAGGNVTLPAQTLNTIIYLVRASTFTQLWDASALNFFDPATVERVVDKLTILMQEVKTDVGSCLRLDDGEVAAVLDKDARKGSVLGFNATTGDIEFTYTQDILDDAVASVAPSLAAAQAAQSLAEAAKSAAELAENHAELAEANAELAETNAETAESNAASHASAASGSASTASTQAGIATTQAGLATTNGAAQVSLAAAQVVLATAQAVAAAGSATTALNAIAQSFKGGISGASVPATSPLSGDYYRITVAGTSQSKTWAIGDAAIYNGSSGSWTQLTGWFAYADGVGMVVASFAGGYTFSDGATPNRAAGIYGPFDAVNNPREWIAGAASLTIAAVLTVPTSVLGSVIDLCTYTSGTTVNSGGYSESNTLRINLFSNYLDIYQLGTSPSNTRRFNYGTFRADYSGQTIFLKITLTQGTTNPVVEVNGVNISASFTASTAGTPTAWLDAAMVPTYRLVGLNWPAGPAPMVTPILGTTSAEDDAFYMQTGKWPAWVVAGGSCVSLSVAQGAGGDFSSNPTSGSFPFTLDAGVTWSGSAIVFNTAGAAFLRASSVGASPARIIAGRVYRAKFTVSNYTSGVFSLRNSSGAGFTVLRGTANIAANGTVDVDFYSTNDDSIMVGSTDATALNATVDDLYWYQLGALSLPAVQPINVLDDVSGIGGNQGRMLGCTPVTPREANYGVIKTSLRATGYVIADAQLIPTGHVIDSIRLRTTSGTANVSLGSSSGAPTDILVSTAINTTWTKVLDPADSSTGKIYLTLSAGTVHIHVITSVA